MTGGVSSALSGLTLTAAFSISWNSSSRDENTSLLLLLLRTRSAAAVRTLPPRRDKLGAMKEGDTQKVQFRDADIVGCLFHFSGKSSVFAACCRMLLDKKSTCSCKIYVSSSTPLPDVSWLVVYWIKHSSLNRDYEAILNRELSGVPSRASTLERK